MSEYIEHYEPYKDLKCQPFKIGENAKRIAKISDGRLIAQVAMTCPNGSVLTAWHTPIPDKLKRYCERSIDALRHSQTIYRAPDDPWWDKTRGELEDAYRMAWIACQGTLPVPPLWNSQTGEAHPLTFHLRGDEDIALYESIKAGMTYRVEVDYLSEPPDGWVCDL